MAERLLVIWVVPQHIADIDDAAKGRTVEVAQLDQRLEIDPRDHVALQLGQGSLRHIDGLCYFALVDGTPDLVGVFQPAIALLGRCCYRDLADYLRTPPHHVALMQSEAALRLVVDDLFVQLVRDHVIYAELRFAPLLHTQGGLSAEQVVATVEQSVAQASAASGIIARVILCTLRHFTQAQSLETVRLVEQFRGTHVVALDIAGDEAGYPLDAHLAAFQHAIERGIPRTAHAGEARGAASVWETLRHLQPSRIGHGLRSIEDPDLIMHLRATGTHLELCPSCNVQIDVVPTYANHPVDRLFQQGVSIGISTDTRTITNVTLLREYERLVHTFSWGREELLTINLNAARAAFVAQAVQRDIEERLREGYHQA